MGPLVNLRELVLDRNRIKSVDSNSFASLPQLRELRNRLRLSGAQLREMCVTQQLSGDRRRSISSMAAASYSSYR